MDRAGTPIKRGVRIPKEGPKNTKKHCATAVFVFKN